MKKFSIVLLFFTIFAFEAFCSHSGKGATYSYIQANEARIIAEIEKRLEANGCGAYGWPEWLVIILDVIGDKEACDQHDIDYATLGMSKEEADERFYYNMHKRVYENFDRILSLLRNSPDSTALNLLNSIIVLGPEVGRMVLAEAIAQGYTWGVKKFAGGAYEKAQADARAYKERTGKSYYPDKE